MTDRSGNPVICRPQAFIGLLLLIVSKSRHLNDGNSHSPELTDSDSLLSVLSRSRDVIENINKGRETNIEELINQLSSVATQILITDLANNKSAEKVDKIVLSSRIVVQNLELLERCFNQGQTNTARVMELENQIETQIGSLLKILLYLPEQPEE